MNSSKKRTNGLESYYFLINCKLLKKAYQLQRKLFRSMKNE